MEDLLKEAGVRSQTIIDGIIKAPYFTWKMFSSWADNTEIANSLLHEFISQNLLVDDGRRFSASSSLKNFLRDYARK